MAVATDEPPPPRELNPKVPKPLSNLVMQLLAKMPEDRPASAKAVVKAIKKIESELTRTAVPSAIPVAEAKPTKIKKETPAELPPSRRKKPLVKIVRVLMAMGVGLACYFIWDKFRPKPSASKTLDIAAANWTFPLFLRTTPKSN